MAFLTLLTITLLVTIASAGSPWPDSESPFPGFNNPMMMLRYAPPPFPQIPNFPFPMFSPFPPFPTMAPIQFPPLPPIPTPEQIAKASPPNGGTYSGLVVTSQTANHANEDGTLSKKGGVTILSNQDGKVYLATTGDSPPEILTKTVPFEFEDLKVKHSKLPKFPKSQFGKNFDGFDHPFPSFKPISRKKIETYVPKEGETFTGHSVRTHRYVSEVNGVKKEGASLSKVENDNGLVNKEILAYQKGDKPED